MGLSQASKWIFGLVWPCPFTSWPHKLIVSCPCPWTTCVNWHQNRFIRFENIVLTSLVTDDRTDGRTDGRRERLQTLGLYLLVWHGGCMKCHWDFAPGYFATFLNLSNSMWRSPSHAYSWAMQRWSWPHHIATIALLAKDHTTAIRRTTGQSNCRRAENQDWLSSSVWQKHLMQVLVQRFVFEIPQNR